MTSKTPTTPPLLLSPIYITNSIFTDSTLIVVRRMDSDFIERIQRINLTEEEDEVVTVGRSQRGKILEECALSLLGRFLTTRPYNQRAAKGYDCYGPDLKIIDVEEGLFQFKFALESQLTWVMSNGPWSFDANLGLAVRLTFRRGWMRNRQRGRTSGRSGHQGFHV